MALLKLHTTLPAAAVMYLCLLEKLSIESKSQY